MAKSKVIEINTFKEVLEHLEEGAHLFLDVDNTLIQPIHDFGSIPWEADLNKRFLALGLSEEEACRRSCAIWRAIQKVSAAKPVEEETQALLLALKKQGYPLIAITARSSDMIPTTERQLASLEIPIDHIIHCGDTPKVEYLLSHLGSNKPKVVFVDDSRGHLDLAAEILPGHHIPFVGLRYGYLDHHVKNYAPDPFSHLLHQAFTHPEAVEAILEGLTDLFKEKSQ